MREIKQVLSFTLLATGLVALAPAAFAETLHLSEKDRAHKMLNDPRVPIVLGAFMPEEEEAAPKVRIPEPRRR